MENEFNKKLHLLVVDDDDDLLVLFYLAMRAKGYEVEISRNAETFWDDVDATHPDIIILDIHMIGVDGAELCKELKAKSDTKKIPIILLSASDDLKHIAEESGANSFIQKPFTAEKVMREVERLVHAA
jgi:two-component system alkaline phosphatase synthesis response regulator PhoP/two-component system response regulator MprA